MNLLQVSVLLLLSAIAYGVEINSPSTFDSDSEGWLPWSTSTPGGQTNSGGLSPGDGNYVIAADGVGQYGKIHTRCLYRGKTTRELSRAQKRGRYTH